MLRYDYEILYKKGSDNVVMDALSSQFEEGGSLFLLLLPFLKWIDEACQEWMA